MPNRGMMIKAGRIEKRLHNYCLKRIKAGGDCKNCPIKDYCFSFLQITPALSLALTDVENGRTPPNFESFITHIKEGNNAANN
jgi:hypothetical protein